jgi:hypothetical protein
MMGDEYATDCHTMEKSVARKKVTGKKVAATKKPAPPAKKPPPVAAAACRATWGLVKATNITLKDVIEVKDEVIEEEQVDLCQQKARHLR